MSYQKVLTHVISGISPVLKVIPQQRSHLLHNSNHSLNPRQLAHCTRWRCSLQSQTGSGSCPQPAQSQGDLSEHYRSSALLISYGSCCYTFLLNRSKVNIGYDAPQLKQQETVLQRTTRNKKKHHVNLVFMKSVRRINRQKPNKAFRSVTRQEFPITPCVLQWGTSL